MSSLRFSLQELADLTHAELIGDPKLYITGVNALEEASCTEASFLANARYQEHVARSSAGVIFISPKDFRHAHQNYLIHENPSLAFQQVARLFLPPQESGFKGIHPTAIIHPSVHIGHDVQIGPYVTIDQYVIIGDRARIYSHVVIGPGSKIGNDCILHAHVTLREGSHLHDRVIIQPGAVIGSCGFGYTTDLQGTHTKLEQLGHVIIEEDVEIGANTTIDRARFHITRIGKGTKVDNLVQIGHNVELGVHNLIVSQTGISGSTKTGKHVILGGQCGVVGHIHIADGIMIAAKGGVSKSLTKPGKYAGVPVMPLEEYNRTQVYLRRIVSFVKRLEHLEQMITRSN